MATGKDGLKSRIMDESSVDSNRSCLDCLYCKVINRRTMLRCEAGEWIYTRDFKERFVVLREEETKSDYIRDREYFRQARSCKRFVSMND